jgi:hypothetical protein
MTMKTLTAVTLLLLFVPASLAQERGYAGPAELKGVRRVYVEADEKNRARIVDELRKSKTGVEVVDVRETAELILSFSTDKVRTLTGVEIEPEYPGVNDGYLSNRASAKYSNVEHAIGSAYVPSADGGRRVFFMWDGKQKNASEKFADAFLKEYRKANGLK